MATDFRLEGTYTALVTPFVPDEGQAIDWSAFDTLLETQIEGGVDGLVPCGTTGESPALAHAEQTEVVKRVVDRARGRARVLAGTGTNSTRETIDKSRDAERAGADAVMVVVPYYNKPTQEGLFRHFVAVCSAVRCPVVAYNIPTRAGIDLATDTLARIVDKAPNLVGIKEATGNVLRAQELARRFGGRLSVMSGDDALTLPMMAVGARGVISVTSNLLPKDIVRLTRLALDGRFVEARSLHLQLLAVHEALFLEANPAPVKAALAIRGPVSDAVRGPLATLSDVTRKAIHDALDAYGRGRG